MKKILTIGLSVLALTATSCKDWLDINDNPNYVAEVSESSLLPTGITLTAARVGYEYELLGYFWAHFAVQCQNNNQYNTIMENQLTNSSSYFGQPWRQAYYAILPTLNDVLSKCEGDEGKLNYVLMAKTMIAFNYHMLASCFEQIPISQALQGEANLTPEYDSAADVQKQIVDLLAEIVAMDPEKAADAEAVNPTTSADMLFGGDTDNWLKFANTLYLKMLMRDFNANKTAIQSVLQSPLGLLDKADAAFAHFSDSADKSNPLYESDRRQLNTNANMGACSDILKVLSANDPRLTEYFDNPSSLGPEAMGVPYGTKANSYANWRVKLGATDPVCFASIAEAEFLQAEAYARLNDAAKARQHYEAGIAASFARWGHADKAAAFIAGDYAFRSGTAEEMVEQIICQKWAASVRVQTWNAWWDINRTGYPAFNKVLTAYFGTANGHPVRFMYSTYSSDYNPNTPAVKQLDEKMWWHKK